jgi:hypothetical protein
MEQVPAAATAKHLFTYVIDWSFLLCQNNTVGFVIMQLLRSDLLLLSLQNAVMMFPLFKDTKPIT